MRRQFLRLLSVLITVTGADQVTKAWSWHHLVDVHINSGGDLLVSPLVGAWFRDLVVVSVGAERAVIHYDSLAELTEDAPTAALGAEGAAEAVREAWRAFEEFNVSPQLALEALFVRLRRALAVAPATA